MVFLFFLLVRAGVWILFKGLLSLSFFFFLSHLRVWKALIPRISAKIIPTYLNDSSWWVRSFVWAFESFRFSGWEPKSSSSIALVTGIMDMAIAPDGTWGFLHKCSWFKSSSSWRKNAVIPGSIILVFDELRDGSSFWNKRNGYKLQS